jgi:hypothetical protein
MTVPCVHLLFRDDVPLPLALFSTHILSDHLYGSLFQTYSSTRSPPLAPRSRYSLYFTAAIRCEVKNFRHRLSHTAHIHSVYFLSHYTFWLWWSRVASMYNILLVFPDHCDVHHIRGRIPPCCSGFVISRG